jgi:hypothetical protein
MENEINFACFYSLIEVTGEFASNTRDGFSNGGDHGNKFLCSHL